MIKRLYFEKMTNSVRDQLKTIDTQLTSVSTLSPWSSSPTSTSNDDVSFDQITHRIDNVTSELDIDSELGLYDIPPWLITVLISIYVCISLTAIVGNSAIIYVVIKSRRLRSTTNYFIANLAVADMAIATLAIPFQFQAALLQKWLLPHFMCQLCPSVQVVSLNVSIFTLVAIALDRYKAVIKPLEARQSKFRTKLSILGIWMVGVGLAIPTFMAFKVKLVMDMSTGIEDLPQCQVSQLPIEFWRVYTQILVGVQYLAPLIIITFAYAHMGLRLCHRDVEIDQSGGTRSNSTQIAQNKRKVGYILID